MLAIIINIRVLFIQGQGSVVCTPPGNYQSINSSRPANAAGKKSTILSRINLSALPIWFSMVFTERPMRSAISWYFNSSNLLIWKMVRHCYGSSFIALFSFVCRSASKTFQKHNLFRFSYNW